MFYSKRLNDTVDLLETLLNSERESVIFTLILALLHKYTFFPVIL